LPTKATIAFFVAPSFHDGSGSLAAVTGREQAGSTAASSAARAKTAFPVRSVITPDPAATWCRFGPRAIGHSMIL
jgi:hypothetical protein